MTEVVRLKDRLDELDIEHRVDICSILRDFRIEAGLSQRELAKQINTNQGHVSAFEQGKYDFRFSTLQMWAQHFGYNIEVSFFKMGVADEDEKVQEGTSGD